MKGNLIRFALCALSFAFSAPAWSFGGSTAVVPSASPSPSLSVTESAAPSASWFRISSAIAGVSIIKGEFAPALALRAELPWDFSLEWGGVFSRSVSGFANASSNGSNDYVQSFAETHFVLLHPLYSESRLTFDAGLGFSLGFPNDHLSESIIPPTPDLQNINHRKILPAPMAMLGARWNLTDHFCFRTDLAYAYYSNNDSYGYQPFNLTFSALMIRPSVEWRF